MPDPNPDDAAAGSAWWARLGAPDRAYWLDRAGTTDWRAAWIYYCRLPRSAIADAVLLLGQAFKARDLLPPVLELSDSLEARLVLQTMMDDPRTYILFDGLGEPEVWPDPDEPNEWPLRCFERQLPDGRIVMTIDIAGVTIRWPIVPSEDEVEDDDE